MPGKYCQWSGRDTPHPRIQPNFHEKVPDRLTHLWVFGAVLLGYVIYIRSVCRARADFPQLAIQTST